MATPRVVDLSAGGVPSRARYGVLGFALSLMAVAYLDGQRPSLVFGRGLFPGQSSSHAVRNEITAWDWRNNTLSMRWWFRADKNTSAYGLANVNTAYVGQGNYEMHPADGVGLNVCRLEHGQGSFA